LADVLKVYACVDVDENTKKHTKILKVKKTHENQVNLSKSLEYLLTWSEVMLYCVSFG